MKRKSVQLMIAAGVVLPLLLGGCGGKEQRMAEHMKKGVEFYDKGDYDKARVEFKNVLQISPNSAEAYFHFGEVEEKQQNWSRAFGYYSKAVELDPNHLAARTKVGRFQLMAGEVDKASQIAQEILAKNPKDAGGLTLKAAALARKGEVDKAIAEASVVAADPTQTDAISLLAGLYQMQGNADKAAAVLEKGIQGNPKNVALRLDLANLAIKQSNFAKAEQLLQEMISLEPKKLEFRVQTARFYTQLKQLDKAEKTLRDAVQADPEDEQRYLLLADFLASARSGDAAEKELVAWTQAKPKAYKLRFGLARLYEAMNKTEEAKRTYQDIIARDKTGPDGLHARNELARMYLAGGKPADGEKLIGEVLKENPRDNAALMMRAKLALARGDAKSAIVDWRAVLKDQPDSVEVLTLLARAHLVNGEPQLAQGVFDTAVGQFPNNVNIRFARADFFAAQRNYDAASKDLDAILTQDAKNLRAIEAKGEVAFATKDWPAAVESLNKLKAAIPNQPLAYFRLGRVYEAQNKADLALAEYEAALARSPSAVDALRGVIRLQFAKGKPDAAFARLNQAVEAAPNNAAIQLLLAEAQANQKRLDESEATLRKVLQSNPRLPEGYLALANVLVAKNNAAGAAQALEQGQAAIGVHPGLATALAEVYQRLNQTDKAIHQYEQVLATDPGQLVAANNVAALLSEAKGDPASLQKALTYAGRFENSDNPIYLDTLGWVYYKMGQYDRAKTLLASAVAKAPDVGVFQYHLGMTLAKKGDTAGAKTALQASLQAKIPFRNPDEVKAALGKL